MRRNARLVSLLFALVLLAAATAAEAARVRVAHRGPRTRVVVRTGFPIHRTLPRVHVRPPRVAVRITPRVYVAPIAFRPVVVAIPAAERRVWSGTEELDGDEEWTELTMNVNATGRGIVLHVEEGPVRLGFAEVVFESGEAQVVDFADRVQRRGVYRLLDFDDPRRIDHVRIVARATDDEATLSLLLVS